MINAGVIPFTQTQMWGSINHYYNNLDPKKIESYGIYCLFGHDKKEASWTSFGGPVLSSASSQEDLHNFLIDLISKAKTENISQINLKSLLPLRLWGSEFEEKLIKTGFTRQEWKTLIVDLTSSQEALFKSFEHSARKGIKKGDAHGIQVERCSSFETYFKSFLVPYFKTTNRLIKDKEFYRKSWDLDNENIYNYWVSKSSEGELLGFLGTFRYDGLATEIMSALTPLAFEKKIPVQDILHWEIMKYHQNLGDQYFDLAGFNPNPISEKEKNIKRFKEKWGGEIYDISSYIFDNRSFGQKFISKIRAKLHE